ncbi:acyl-CoA dehydrogenase family protein [uncultured Caballeronia sp.]|uniref:acyl-CoA dehydrogenase family protein n=1 Tax=uncultured Caballeronia sp. TaxID=1827198 RepID=UPI0015768772
MNDRNPLSAELSRANLLDQAREVGEFAFSRREQAEKERRMPDDVVEKLRETGLMKLCRHRKYGGAEADPMTFLDVGREIARGSASLGWIYSVLGFHDWYMAFTSEKLQEEVWGKNPDAFVCDSFAPVGQIERVAEGYTLSGNWRFASGIEWSSWIAVGGIAVAPNGNEPEHLLFFVPREEVTVHDDWNTLGLKGTASRAVTIKPTFVPEHRAFALARVAGESRGKVVNDGPLWRIPLMTMQGLAILTPSIGIAQRVVEEFTSWTKARIRPYEHGAAAREAPAPQLALASAATQWDASWALAQKYAQEGWDRALSGETWVLSEEERAKYFSWRGYIGRSSIELSDQLFIGSGAMALFDSHPLQQLFRDVHSTGVHIGVDRADAYTSRGRVAMGFPGHAFH